MDMIFSYLQGHEMVLLLLIVVTGFLIGKIKLWNFSLEASGILFAAMVFGHYGFSLNSDFQVMGLLFFIYAIGLQAGPSIFNILKMHGLQLYTLVFLLISSGGILTLVLAKLWDIDMALAIGLFTGAMTSTPGLAAAQEATHSALTSTGYGVVYPVGIIGVILFIKALPAVFGVDLKDEETAIRQAGQQKSKVVSRFVLLTNEQLSGRSLRELNFSTALGTVVSRIIRDRQTIIPGPDTVLEAGDKLCLVGSSEKLKAAVPYLGKVCSEPVFERSGFDSQRFVVTNRDIVGKSVEELNLFALYHTNITRIRRGGMEFTAEPHHRINWGDRIRVAGEAQYFPKVKALFGDEMAKLETGNIFSILSGILMGIIFGLVPFSIGKFISINLGLTGGVLFAGILLSNRGKIGPFIWQVPGPIIQFMRDFGLVLFLAVVGVKSGAGVLDILRTEGPKLLAAGLLLTLIPMAVITLAARLKYRLMLVEIFGLITGGMTSTPGLAVSSGMTTVQRPLVIYATVYPFAMILMMVWTKILALF